MIARGMSSSGKRWAALFAVALGFLLPKSVECGWPGGECATDGPFRQVCHTYELEPLGFYLIEKLVERDVGFAYSTSQKCR
ncbi:MAG: hypothetical protein ACTHU0_36425 [Kofleriaceae bacterium]